MSNPNRRGALTLVSASMCLVLAALFSFEEPPSPALTAAGDTAIPAAADWGLSFPAEGEGLYGYFSSAFLSPLAAPYRHPEPAEGSLWKCCPYYF